MARKTRLSKTMAQILERYDRIEIPEWGAIYRKKPDASETGSRPVGFTPFGVALVVVVGATLISALVAFIPLMVATGS
jgi:hypothetical protein